MKLGINQWAFPAGTPVQRAMAAAREAGFAAFELCVGLEDTVLLDSSEKQLQDIRRHGDQLEIEISSVATALGWQFPLTSADPRVQAEAKRILLRLIEMCQVLDAGTLLVMPGVVTPDIPYDRAIENSLNALLDVLPAAEEARVTLALENVWNRFLLSPVEMRDFIDQFQSEFVGAYLDVGNILAYGYPEHWVRILGKRIRAIHAKDYRIAAGTEAGFVMLLEGDVDWPAVMRALEEAGYSGPLIAEVGPYRHDGSSALRHAHTALQAIRNLV
ncbi:MAG: sugar phosphate isomerase/epimerase [Candidatus Hydrogenedentes bacterium]|nr:sugar phosphate isomerase/epimerase [Candidatus Hydrogenedentota bacterium]